MLNIPDVVEPSAAFLAAVGSRMVRLDTVDGLLECEF